MLEFLDISAFQNRTEGSFWVRCGEDCIYCKYSGEAFKREPQALKCPELVPLSLEIVLSRIAFLGLTIEEFISATEGL